MADFSATYVNAATPLWATIDPFDFLAVFSPLVYVSDIVTPTVTLVSPLDGSVTRMEPIVFDVVDDRGLGLHVIFVEYPDVQGLYEVAYDGESFTRGAYSVTRVVIPATSTSAAGWRYTVLRKAGWLGKPTIRVKAADTGGNQV